MEIRRIICLLVVAFMLTSCSSNESIETVYSAVVSAAYSTGSIVPLVGDVLVFESGTVVVTNFSGKTRRRSLGDHPSFQRLISSLSRAEFADDLSVIAAKRYEDRYFEEESLTILTADHKVTLPIEKAAELTPAVRRVLKELDALALIVMKDRLDFQLNIENQGSH